jgi:cardiolipin synthase
MAARIVQIVPNVLSSLRLVLALVFPLLPEDWRLPAMIAGGLSDWIDGVVARRYKAITAAGTMLDAIADKLFTLSVLLTIILGSGEARWWQGLIVLSRDFSVAAISLYALSIRRYDAFGHMRPRLPGKLTTTLVFLWLVTVLAGAAPMWSWGLFILAGACSVIAGADYLVQFSRRAAAFRGVARESI